MRKFSFIAVILIVTAQFSFSQTATVEYHFKNVSSGIIKVMIPVNDIFMSTSFKEIPIQENGACTIPYTGSQPGRLPMFFFEKNISLFIAKGDHVVIEMDTAQSVIPKFSGSNAAGHALFMDKNFPREVYMVRNFSDSTAELLAAHIEAEKKIKLDPFKKLYAEKKISADFMNCIQKHVDYLYATCAVDAINRKFGNALRAKIIFPVSYRSYWEQTLSTYPVLVKNGFRIIPYGNYVDQYLTYMFYKDWEAKDSAVYLPLADMAARVRGIFKSDKALVEQAEGRQLFFRFLSDHFEKELLTEMEDFNQRYPNSKLTAGLKPFVDKSIAFHKSADAGFTPDQKLVEGYESINAFQDMVAKFKGQMVFIDTWATWCGPCIAEFKYKDSLQGFLKKNNVAMVYLSLDDESFSQHWTTMIKYYNLSGYHLRANKKLYDDFIRLFGVGTSIAIPRYILVDEKGAIVEKTALRPSDTELLYKQVASHL